VKKNPVLEVIRGNKPPLPKLRERYRTEKLSKGIHEEKLKKIVNLPPLLTSVFSLRKPKAHFRSSVAT